MPTTNLPAWDYYDRYWRSEGWETRPPLKLLELFHRHISDHDRCLDVGCGDGGTSGIWLNEWAASYVGVDVSEAAVEMARDRGLDVRCVQDAAALPFEEGSFDVAVCVEVLEHLFEPQRAMVEIGRVLRPGGRVILTVPNVAHWRSRVDGLLGRWNPRGDHLSATEPWRDAHLRFFTIRSLTNMVQRCGFEVVARGGYDEHGFAHYVPGLRRLAGSAPPTAPSRRAAELHPRLLAGRIYVVAMLSSRGSRAAER
ncbi:MAG TPA: class I SAM-dependent methyltransferase [Solirubrobacteraceae bacterium]